MRVRKIKNENYNIIKMAYQENTDIINPYDNTLIRTIVLNRFYDRTDKRYKHYKTKIWHLSIAIGANKLRRAHYTDKMKIHATNKRIEKLTKIKSKYIDKMDDIDDRENEIKKKYK